MPRLSEGSPTDIEHVMRMRAHDRHADPGACVDLLVAVVIEQLRGIIQQARAGASLQPNNTEVLDAAAWVGELCSMGTLKAAKAIVSGIRQGLEEERRAGD